MKCNITVGYYQRKLHQMYRIASLKCTCRLWNLGCYAANRVRNRLVTSATCKNAWCKLDLTMNRTLLRLRLTSGATVWDHCVHACWWPPLWTHAAKLLLILYYTVHWNTLWNCRC